MSNCENCANAYDEGYQAGHNAENARLNAVIADLKDRLIVAKDALGPATNRMLVVNQGLAAAIYSLEIAQQQHGARHE